MKFGFIAHPTSVSLKNYVKMLDLIKRSADDLNFGYKKEIWQKKNIIPFLDFVKITSPTGASCEGSVRYMPLMAEEVLGNAKTVQKRIEDGINELADDGANIVGLGGFTSIIGRRGLQTAERSPVPVTSGNSLTTYSAFKTIEHVFNSLDLKPSEERVAIIGYPGSICLSLSLLLLEAGYHLDLIHRSSETPIEKLKADIPDHWLDRVTFNSKPEACYQKNKIFAAATSSGGLIDPDRLTSGSIFIDIALPRDISGAKRTARNDILLLDGGCMNAGPEVKFGGESLNLSVKHQLNGCLAETMILALENKSECYSIGRILPPENVLKIGELAAKHGFHPLPLASYGEKLSPDAISGLKRFYKVQIKSGSFHSDTSFKAIKDEQQDDKNTLNRFKNFINPMMSDFLRMQRCDRVFVRAEGRTLTTSHGDQFLDLVAGYGCLNLGHNPNSVTTAMKNYMSEMGPNFVQYISIPEQTSRLAEMLAWLCPGNLERSFFSNSGTEAVEAALKLARAANPRPQVLYAENSYHGKTLGSLSVTGREKHRKQFEPLIPNCASVPYGCLESLETALATNQVCAFILEPIQGEGGVHVPPDQYLKKVEILCKRYDVLFILDEIQTGLGRTGKLFACEWEQVVPDILILSKSLSGGMVPVGATITTREIWDRAYGSSDRFLLHTSTFGGGNLASVAAMAALSELADENVLNQVTHLGNYFKDGLTKISADFSFIEEIRGKGLMLGIQFANHFDQAMEACAREFAARLPGDWHQMYKFFPDDVRDHLEKAMHRLEESLGEVFCMKFVAKLGMDHKILTFVTANSSTVIRIQPPLTITKNEIDSVLASVRKVCEDLSSITQ